MDHVNNAVYADWLDEAVIAAGDLPATRAIPRLARLEYAAPAEPGRSRPPTSGRSSAAGRSGCATLEVATCCEPGSNPGTEPSPGPDRRVPAAGVGLATARQAGPTTMVGSEPWPRGDERTGGRSVLSGHALHPYRR